MSTTTIAILALACLSGVGLMSLFLIVSGYALGKGAQATIKGIKKVSKIIAPPLPPSIRQSLKEARHYGKLIMNIAQQNTTRQHRFFTDTLTSVNTLLTNLSQLEEKLEQLYQRRNLAGELGNIQSEITGLRRQLQRNAGKQALILENLLESKIKHQTILQDLQAFQQQIELTIQQNAAVLNSTHAEITLLAAKDDLDNIQFRRVNDELRENSATLRDLLQAMDEMDQERYSIY